MKTTVYFLFGESICRTYAEQGFSAVMEEAKLGDYTICKYSPLTDSTAVILEAHDGMLASAEITDVEYAQLFELQNQHP